MTINKSQGQTLHNVVVYLPHPVFAHGQLYTALSRVGDPRHIKILVKNGRRADAWTYTANVVHKQVVQRE
jgi:ATP-dependent DNA helicase PIF1